MIPGPGSSEIRFHGLHPGQAFYYNFVGTRRVYFDGKWQQGSVTPRDQVYMVMLDPIWQPDFVKKHALDIIEAGPSNGLFTIGYYQSTKNFPIGFLWTPGKVDLIQPYADGVSLAPPIWWVEPHRPTAWERLLGDLL